MAVNDLLTKHMADAQVAEVLREAEQYRRGRASRKAAGEREGRAARDADERLRRLVREPE